MTKLFATFDEERTPSPKEYHMTQQGSDADRFQ